MGGNFQGLGIVRSLSRQKVPTCIVDNSWSIGRFSRYVDIYRNCPSVKQENELLECLIALAKNENFRGWLIYPNDDEMVHFLAKYRAKLEQYYRITSPPMEVIQYTNSKRMTYKLAEKCGIAIPKTFYPQSAAELEKMDIQFPAIIKPSVKDPFYSKIKKKAIMVEDRSQLLIEYDRVVEVLGESPNLMIQELIPGKTSGLYSVGSLFKNGEFLAKVVVRRPRQHPMDFGHATTYAETVNVPEIEMITKRILTEMNYHGISEVEFMLDSRDNKYKLLEINARPWGWHTIAIAAGVDLPYLSYLDTLEEKVTCNNYATGVKWIRLATDIPTVAIELFRGRMQLSQYLSSLKGKKTFAVFKWGDLLPFIMEIIMLPYYWRRKGFW
jgi:predicted ATP-grasp superfamily ATP-dependent carboligase